METTPKPLQGVGKNVGAHREGKALSPSQPSIPEGRFLIRTCLGVGGRLRAHKWWRPGGNEVMWGVAASRGSGNGCPWEWVGGGRRPSAHEGEPGKCKWAWEAAGLDPWALQDPGSEIWPRGSGHVWLPARAFTCAGDCLVCDVHLGVSHAQPQELLGGVAAVHVELVMAKPHLLLSPGHTWSPAAAAPPGTPSTLTGGLLSFFGSSSLPWVKVFWRNQIVYDFTLNHDISQGLESKAFLYVFMVVTRCNTALVKGKIVKLLSRVRLFATPCTVANQAPPSMGFYRQVYWRGLPFPSPGDLPNPGIEPGSPAL